MNKYLRISLLLIFILTIFGCNTLKKGLVPKKKSGADEFLIEKKKPLVMPPAYGELPTPTLQKVKKEQKPDIQKIIKGDNSNNQTAQNNELDESFEKSILEKIKSNND